MASQRASRTGDWFWRGDPAPTSLKLHKYHCPENPSADVFPAEAGDNAARSRGYSDYLQDLDLARICLRYRPVAGERSGRHAEPGGRGLARVGHMSADEMRQLPDVGGDPVGQGHEAPGHRLGHLRRHIEALGLVAHDRVDHHGRAAGVGLAPGGGANPLQHAGGDLHLLGQGEVAGDDQVDEAEQGVGLNVAEHPAEPPVSPAAAAAEAASPAAEPLQDEPKAEQTAEKDAI